MIGIYSITSPTGKIYIGQSVDIEKRFYYYQSCWKHIKKQRRLYNSIKKYGAENHIFKIIKECSEDELDYFEIEFIAKFNTTKDGLNLKHGGIGGRHTEETKQRIGESNKGISRPKTPEQIKKLTGQKRSKETKLKMSMAAKGKKITWGDKISEVKQKNPYKYTKEDKEKMMNCGGIPILQFTKDGEFIKEFPSAKQAQRETGIKHDAIFHCLKGKSKTSGGFVWKYK